MGKKRKQEKEREKIERKIRRLNKKLEKIDSDSDDDNSPSLHLPSEEPGVFHLHSATEPTLEEEVLGDRQTPPIDEDVTVLTAPELVPSEELLLSIDEDILTALGEVEQVPKGPIAHKELVNRWVPILSKGLTKEVRTNLSNEHIPFENIPMMVPPKLNPEIMAAVSEPVKKRDSIIADRQRQMGTALQAIGTSLQLFLNKGDKIKIIKNINDAAKILCDTIHNDTKSRRSLISATINKDMKDCLTEEADTLLFGNNLSEKIRTTKAVQKSVKDLKNMDMTNKPPYKNKTLNWRGLPRPTVRAATGGRPNNQPVKQRRKDDRKQRQPLRNNFHHKR